jgi:hypothetical protein
MQISNDAVAVPYPMIEGDIPDYYRIEDEKIVPLTRGEYKAAMRKEWTKRGVPLPSCKHVFVPGSEPRHRNCESCWFVFFQTHGELTQTSDEVFAKHGAEALVAMRGPKFTKYFLRFMGALAQWKKLAEEAKDANGDERTSGIGEVSGSECAPGDDCGHTSGHLSASEGEDDWGGINPLGGSRVQD